MFSHAKFVNSPNVPQVTDLGTQPPDRTYDQIDRKIAYEQNTTNSAMAASSRTGRGDGMENPLYKAKDDKGGTQGKEANNQYTTIDVKF